MTTRQPLLRVPDPLRKTFAYVASILQLMDGSIRAAQQGGGPWCPSICQDSPLKAKNALSAGTLLAVGLGRSKAYMDVSTTNRLSTEEEVVSRSYPIFMGSHETIP